MPSDSTSWNTNQEISFLKELASRDLLEFGRSRRGRNKIVNCKLALAGYAASFEARANWHKVDRQAVREWLTQYRCRPATTPPLLGPVVILNDKYGVADSVAKDSLTAGLEHQLPTDMGQIESESRGSISAPAHL